MKKYLPNICTYMALFMGVWGFFLLMEANYLGFLCVMIGFLFDILDGALARKFNQESEFGAWLDLFADLFLYILCPVLLVQLEWPYQSLDMVLVVFVIAGITRLVRTGTKGLGDGGAIQYYKGLPVVFSLPFFVLGVYLGESFVSVWILVLSLLFVLPFKFPKPSLALTLLFWILVFGGFFLIFED